MTRYRCDGCWEEVDEATVSWDDGVDALVHGTGRTGPCLFTGEIEALICGPVRELPDPAPDGHTPRQPDAPDNDAD